MASYRRTRLRGNPKSSKFTSRSHALPRQSPQKVAREPCGNPKSCNFTSRSHARPRQSPQRVAREPCRNSMYFTLIYFTLCTMHLTRCTSLDVLHADLLHSVYYALHSVYYAPVYYALDTMHFNRCIMHFTLCTMRRCTMHSILCTSIDVLTLCT